MSGAYKGTSRRSRRQPGGACGCATIPPRCASGPDVTHPSARPSTAPAPTSRSFPRLPTRVELCLFDDNGGEDAGRSARADRALLARLPARREARASATASASTGRGRPSRGMWCNPAKLLLDPYAKAIDGAVELERGGLSVSLRRPRVVAQRSRQRAVRAEERRHQPVLRLGAGPPAGHAVAPHGRLRNARQGLHQAHPRHPGGAARHLRRPGAPGRRSATCSASASPRSSCCRCTSSCRTRRCSIAGCATTGATTRSATSRRTTSTRAASAASRCRSSSTW